MNRKLLKTLQYVLFLGIGAGLLYLAFRGINLEKMLQDLSNAKYLWVTASMFCGLLAFISRGIRWRYLLEPMGYKTNVVNSSAAVAFGYMANIAVPRLGEIARCTVFNQAEKVPVNKLFGTILLERAIDFVMLFLTISLAVLLKGQALIEFFKGVSAEQTDDQNTSISIVLWIILGLIVLVIVLTYLLRNKIRQTSIYGKLKDFWQGLKEGFRSIKALEKKSAFVIHTLIIWLMYYLMTYLSFFSLPETTHLTPADGLFIMVVGSFGMIAPVQGGIGAYHFVTKIGMTLLGVTALTGLSFATIVHTSQTLMTLVIGGLSFIILYLAKQKHRNSEPTE